MSELLSEKRVTRRKMLKFAGLGAGLLVAACQPQIVEVEKVIEKPVIQTVEVEKIVEKAVVQTVEVEKIVEKAVVQTVEVEKVVEKVVKETIVVEKVVEREPAAKPLAEIRIHTNQGDQWYGWWHEAWKTNVAGWKSEHPHILPKFEPVAGWLNEYFPVIFAHVAAGTLGDIVWTRGTHRSNLSWALEYDICRDLMPIIDAVDYDLDQLYPGVVAQSSWEGKFYYMPLTSEPTTPVIAYNRDLVESMGVGEPQDDWDYMELTEWAQEMTREGVYGFHTAHLRNDTIGGCPQFRQFGAKMASDDGKIFLPEKKDVEAIEKVYQWRHDLIHKYKVMPGLEAEFNEQDMMVAGKLASMCCWPVMLGRLPSVVGEKFRVGWTYTPLDKRGSKRRSRLHEHVHGLTTASKHPEEAFEFLAYHSSLEFAVQGILVGKGSTVGRPDFFEDPRTLRILPNIAKITPIMKEIEADFFVANYRGPEVEREFKANADLILLNKLGVKEGVAKMKEVCQAAMDKPIA